MTRVKVRRMTIHSIGARREARATSCANIRNEEADASYGDCDVERVEGVSGCRRAAPVPHAARQRRLLHLGVVAAVVIIVGLHRTVRAWSGPRAALPRDGAELLHV
jgi:hypothetical protein